MTGATIRSAQRAIDKARLPLEIVRGEGYHYFIYSCSARNHYDTVSVYVCYTNTYAPAEWADIAKGAWADIKAKLA